MKAQLIIRSLLFFFATTFILQYFSSIPYSLQKFTLSLLLTYLFYRQETHSIYIKDVYKKLELLSGEFLITKLMDVTDDTQTRLDKLEILGKKLVKISNEHTELIEKISFILDAARKNAVNKSKS